MSFLSRIFAAREPEPEPPAPLGDPIRIAEVESVLLEITPLLAADGGRARLVSISADGRVELALEGSCSSCALVPLTLRGAIEPRLRASCAWVTAVVAVKPAKR